MLENTGDSKCEAQSGAFPINASGSASACIHISIYIYICVCVCACVHVLRVMKPCKGGLLT